MSDDDEDTSAFVMRGAVTKELIDTDDSEDDSSALILKSKQHVKYL